MFNDPISIDLRRELLGLPIIIGTGERALHPPLYVVDFNLFFKHGEYLPCGGLHHRPHTYPLQGLQISQCVAW